MRQLTQELRQLGIQKGVEINSPAVALMHRDSKQEKLETIVQLENDHFIIYHKMWWDDTQLLQTSHPGGRGR